MWPVGEDLRNKCKKHNMPYPLDGEQWETSLIKILNLIEYLELKLLEKEKHKCETISETKKTHGKE